MQIRVHNQVKLQASPRVQQLSGMFDLTPGKVSEFQRTYDIPLEQHPWQVGLIVGPSGSGKSSVARQLWPDQCRQTYKWPDDRSVIDGFPETLPIKRVANLLSSIGFSSPPSWLRPFRCLSNGEQFRVTIARMLAESTGLVVCDEFTSVVDRTVAQIASHAIAKAVRKAQRQFVAVSCHYDVLPWLDPCWVLDVSTGQFQWRLERQPRPAIELTIIPVKRAAWDYFRQHHYLSHSVSPLAQCFMALVEGARPAAFCAIMHQVHPRAPSWREHRTVCLPDFQGCGIGNALSEALLAAYKTKGKPVRSVTSHPAMIYHRAKSKLWHMQRAPSNISGRTQRLRGTGREAERTKNSRGRATASFRFVGPARPDLAAALLIAPAAAAAVTPPPAR